MKTLLLGLSLMLSFNTFALDRQPISGSEGIEIYNVLAKKLNVKPSLHGNSSETGCYNIKSHDLLGMYCNSGTCTN